MTLTLFITSAIALAMGFMVYSFSNWMTKVATNKQARENGLLVDDSAQNPLHQTERKTVLIACTLICVISGIISLHYALSISENNPKLAQSLTLQYQVTVDSEAADQITCYQGVLHAPKLNEKGFEPFPTDPNCTPEQLDHIKAEYNLDNARDIVGVTAMIFLLSLFGFGVLIQTGRKVIKPDGDDNEAAEEYSV